MSNFICPPCGLPCGFNNIDYGKAGYKTDREIELEKKLEIAVKALEFYAIPLSQLSSVYNIAQHHKRAQEALAKIKEIK